MFYLKNPSINPSEVFPKVMPEKICANFTCKGKECSNASYDFIHPRKSSELKRKTIIAIADHFNKTNIGWFDEYHFMKMPNITNGVKKLLGNTRGISSMNPSSPPKLVWPAQSTSISFNQALSNKLHSSLVLRPSVSQKIQNPSTRSKLHVIANLNQPIPTATPPGINSQIAFLLSNKNPELVNQATPINDPIIVQGTRDKKRILDDYQKKFGKDSNDSIIARKKGKIF
jgi:hypothetical protein